MRGNQEDIIEIFYCYSHKDKRLCDELEKSLQILRNQGQPIKWDCREISAQREWTETPNSHLSTAHIVLLLLSRDFIATDYLRSETDMKRAFYRLKMGTVRIVPILCRPVDYTGTPISDLRFLPHDNRAVTRWPNQDEAFLDISQGIKEILEEIKREQVKKHPENQEEKPVHKPGYSDLNDHLGSSESSLMDEIFDNVSPVLQETEAEAISPSTERSAYLFDTINDLPRSSKKGKKNVSSSTPQEYSQLPLFTSEKQTEALSYASVQGSVSSSEDQNAQSAMKGIPDYEDLRKIASNQPKKALDIFADIDIGAASSNQRWRLAALQGHCYFGLGKFLPARQSYTHALQEKPDVVPKEQLLEETLLYLKLAETNRELGNLAEASEQYHIALAHTNSTTRIGHLAEMHWGLALTSFERFNRSPNEYTDLPFSQQELLKEALGHAESARQLYELSGDALNAASVSCDRALFEQISGQREKARMHLSEVLDTWVPMLHKTRGNTVENRRRAKAYNNIVSAASCYLAGIDLEAHEYDRALSTLQQSQEPTEHSNILRKGEAAMMHGKILEAKNLFDPTIEEIYREALALLSSTELLAARVRAHDLLGRYLLKIGNRSAGEKELDEARKLSYTAMFSH